MISLPKPGGALCANVANVNSAQYVRSGFVIEGQLNSQGENPDQPPPCGGRRGPVASESGKEESPQGSERRQSYPEWL